MRLPSVRFTVRRMMVAVAIVGLLIGSGRWVVVMRTRSAAYRKRAYEFAGSNVRIYASDFDVTAKDGMSVSVHEDENFWLREEWAKKLGEKYWRLADRPWLPAEPDPPRPEPLVHGRSAIDCPAALRLKGPLYRWVKDPVYPWWTFLWTWRSERFGMVDPRYSFP